jgi:ZIP family zinc transporter
MVYISIVNMLPTARKYDPNDKYTSKFMWAGMLVMGASLVTFEEAAPEL